MQILALIPARGGSKGIPGKNIKPLGDRPLIAHTIGAALASGVLADVVVTTDDEAIAETARRYGAEVPFLRPAHLADDASPTLGAVLHALDFLAASGRTYDAVCLLQATTPFRRPGEIEGAVAAFERAGTDSLITVLPVPHEYNPHWVFGVDPATGHLRIATGEDEIITRRQDLPPAYIRDGSVYLTKTSVLRDKQSLYGNSIAHFERAPEGHVNLDTLDDWKRAETLVHQFVSNI